MKKTMWINILMLVFVPSVYAGWFKIPFGRVVSFTGNPVINKRTIRPKQKVFVGDLVVTDTNSTVKIKGKKGDIFFIGPDTKIIIKDKEDLKLKDGTLRSIIHKLTPKEAFRVSTGGGVAGVKGTEFIVYSNEHASAVFTKQGKVYLKNKKISVTTNKGQMSQSAYNVAPIEPVSFEDNGTLKEMYNTLLNVTGLQVPKEMKKFKELPEIIARWNITFTNYLIDKKKFNEALKYLNIAFLFTSRPEVKAEILYQKSIIKTRFLKDYHSGNLDLESIITNYPRSKFCESAFFQRGFLKFEEKKYKKAIDYLTEYKKRFPNGRFDNEVDLLIKKCMKHISNSTLNKQ